MNGQALDQNAASYMYFLMKIRYGKQMSIRLQPFSVTISSPYSLPLIASKWNGFLMMGIHWVKWDLLCKSKFVGGLGFRDLEAFNQALLVKQCWCILCNPESLVARVFRARYHHSSYFLEANVGTNPSLIWSSLQWGKELLNKGLHWRVQNGVSIKVYNDKWIPTLSLFKIMSPPQLPRSTLVCDLFTSLGQWNVHLLKHDFWDEEVEAVVQIPLVSLVNHDQLIWH
ncbi:hypothetical protein GBA52_010245 [Prunus armeniaca]|nr:hypothetical protein GBA52_010245 [Prunus armeniaca]